MKWQKQSEDSRIPIKSWCENCGAEAAKQAENLARHPALFGHVALMPDAHLGVGMPIGGVIAADNVVIPAAVGVDIGCGMIATETDIPAELFSDMAFRRAFQEKLKERIPVGEGISFDREQTWEGFDSFLDNNGERAEMWTKGRDRKNLGTLGGGNHFIELQKTTAINGQGEPDGGSKVWLMIHSGSRNLGKRIEEHYQKIAEKMCSRYKVALEDPKLSFLPYEEIEGHHYFTDMLFALRYAKENRRRMMETAKETLAEFAAEVNFIQTIDVHHNYASFEKHFGRNVCIHRKGATSARLDEVGIIPGSMGTASYIVRGLGNPESFMSCSHGAGRKMSRIAVSTKLTVEECDIAMKGIVCEPWQPFHLYGRIGKGKMDLSEAPQAYKDIESVIDAERDLVEPMVRLVPLASLKG